MSQRLIVPLLAAGLVLLGGWLLAQPPRPARDQAEVTSGNFTATAAGDSAVLLETRSGKAWVLRQSADGSRAVWLPTERIDRPDEAQQWVQKERETQARLNELERKIRAENEKHTQSDLEELEKQKRRLIEEGVRGTPKK